MEGIFVSPDEFVIPPKVVTISAQDRLRSRLATLELDLGRKVASYFGPGEDADEIRFEDIIVAGEEIRRLRRQLRELAG